MFKKLVSNLPFNPSLISHLRDYDLKLKQDIKLRLYAVILLILVIIIQIIMVVLPPSNSNQYSPNNLVNNTSNSVNQLFSDCNKNQEQYRSILDFYGLSCNQIYYGTAVKLALKSSNNSLFSLNRLSYNPQIETTVTISGQRFYIRPLLYGSNLATKYLAAWKLNTNSQTYYIALDSGDIISSKQALINNQNRQLCSLRQTYACFSYSLSVRSINSSNIDANDTTLPSGNSLVYTLSATNVSTYKISSSTISINLQNALAYSALVNTYGGKNQNGIVSYKLSLMLPKQTQTEIITTKIKSPLPSSSISGSDPNYLDQKMITTFGNSVVVYVPKTINKFYEININNYLPSVSGRDSLIILVVMLLITVYLLHRISVIRQEIKIIRHSHMSHEEKLKK